MMLGPVAITQYFTEGPLKGERADNLDVGFWSVGRTEDLRDVENPDNEVYNYNWMVSVMQKDGSSKQYVGDVWHRYGDGWIELLRKVFESARAEEAKEGVVLEVVPPGPDS